MALDWSLLGEQPQFQNVLAAYQTGRQARKEKDTENALALYTQDPEAGIAAATRTDPKLALQLRADYTTTRKEADTRKVFQTADPQARMSAATETGDPQIIQQVMALDTAQRARAKETTEALGGFAFGLRKLPYDQRKAAIQQALPAFQGLGLPTDKLVTVDPTDAYLDAQIGEAQTLAQMIAHADAQAAADKPVTVGAEETLVDPKTGKTIFAGPGKPHYEKLGPGDVLVDPSQPGGAAVGGGQPRSARNNNPGNIEDGAFAQGLPGYKGSDGRFAIFESPAAGTQAQAKLLQSYGQKGINTVEGIISRWAPKEDSNPTPAYIQFVAQKLGVDPKQPLDLNNPQVLSAVSGAIAQFEAGGQSASNGGARVIAQGGPKPQARPATPEEKAKYGIPANVPAQMKPDGSIDVLSGTGTTLKPVPRPVMQGYLDNATSARKLKAAIAALDAYPGAVGLARMGGEGINQRIDPKGVDARAAIADVGSLIIHDRSGAAVTVSEAPRLMPFIPTVTDTSEAAKKKLTRLLKMVDEANVGIETAYDPGEGYQPLPGTRATAPASAPATNAPTKRPSLESIFGR